MIPRIAIEHLRNWRSKPNRKPLFIRGARQVGKTILVNNFAAEFDNFLSFNLEAPRDQSVFERFNDIDKLVRGIFLERQLSVAADNTLIFIDEIQESHNAIVQLQYFYEKYPDLHVIAAASLPETAIAEDPAFPDGHVEEYVLHPVSFHEYLLTIGQMGLLAAYLETPVPEYAHRRLLEVYNEYAVIGGMPEIVSSYLADRDLTPLAAIYDNLLTSYRDDILKYSRNSNAINVLRHVMQAAPHEADKRIKFERFGNSQHRSREVGEALRALEAARVLKLVYPTTSTTPPFSADRKKSPRLQFLDTGLNNYAIRLQNALFGLEDLASEHSHVIRHLTTQELLSRHSSPSFEPSFWVRQAAGSQAEVDLVYAHENDLIPIEVKSAKQGRLRSLHQFMDTCPHTFAIRLYGGEFLLQSAQTIKGKSYQLLNLPYYLAGRIPEYAAWLVGKQSIAEAR